MREILFRGKQVNNKKWVYGVPVSVEFNSYKTNKIEMVYSHGYDELDHLHLSSNDEEVIPETVGQFTGLMDKKCNKIFEGDIIKDDGENKLWFVAFESGSMLAVSIREGSIFWGNDVNLSCINEESEIIGNVFDNPELVEGNA